MKFTAKEITYTGLFVALIAIGAFLYFYIPLPLYTMHFTLQWLFVLLAGFLLGKKLGTLSVVAYIGIGLAGVPVFAAGGGIGYVLIEAAQIIYYAVLSCHIALSFSNALITLGRLSDIKKKRIIDIVVLVICVLLFIAVSVIITTTHTKIFG